MTSPDIPRRTMPFSLLTLGVSDVERSAHFYVTVGFERPPGPAGLVLLCTTGTVIALHPWPQLAEDAGLASEGPTWGFRGVCMASNQASRADVDSAYTRWMAADGSALRPPHPTDWGGYAGYVADPDGHLWELAYNPFLDFTANGGFVVRA